MKKFSKITAVILTVFLLCGLVVSFAASANEVAESREALNVSGASHNRYTDFESTKADGKHYIVPAFAWASGQKGNVIVSYQTGSDGNTYVNYSAVDKTSTSTAKVEGWIPLTDYGWGYQRNGQANIGAHDYVIIDFEFGTDKYSYKDAGGTWHTVDKFTDIPEAYRPADPHSALAFDNGMSININGRGATVLSSAGDNNGKESNFANIYVVKDSSTGKWYISSNSTYSEDDLELSNEVGVYDHITYVFKVSRTADSNRTTGYNFNATKSYAFVNGEFLTSSSITSSYDSIAPNAIRFMVPESDRTSFCFDNVAINWYGHRAMKTETVDEVTYYKYSTVDTVYVSEGYGIDDYITSEDYKTQPLYTCEDVVYGENYISPNGYVSVDGNKASLDFKIAELLTLVKHGSVIETTFDILNYELPAGVEKLTVRTVGGAKFTLANEYAKEFLVIPGSNNTYTVRRATEDDYISIKWVYIDENGEETVLDETDDFSFGYLPSPSLEATKSFKMDELKYYETDYVNWTIDIDGDSSNFGEGYSSEVNLYDPEPLRALTAMEILLIREELGGVLKVVSTEQSHRITDFSIYEFIIGKYNEEGLFYPSFDSEGGYDKYNSMDNFAAEVSAAASDSYVILAYDLNTPCDIGGDTSITIGKGKTINLDLNGRTLVQSNGATTTKGNEMFIVEEEATFNLYSSKAGAAIYQAKFNSSENSKVVANGIIKIDYMDTATVNVGDVYDAEGNLVIDSSDDIAFYGGTFITVGSLAADVDAFNERILTINDGNQITINVNGGTYYQAFNSSIFTVMCPDVYINLNDATFINVSSGASAGIFRDEKDSTMGSNKKYYASLSTVTAKNCEFISMKDGSTTNAKLYSSASKVVKDDTTLYTSAYFEDCVILSAITNISSTGANVTLGPGCTVAGAITTTKVSIAEGVISVDNETEEKVSLSVSYPKMLEDPDDTMINGAINPAFFDKSNTNDWRIDYVRESTIKFTTEKAASSEMIIETPNDLQSQETVSEVPVTQSGVNANNGNDVTVDMGNDVEVGDNDEILSSESNSTNLAPVDGLISSQNASDSNYVAWIGFAVSMLAIAIAVVMIAKRRSRN